MNPATADCTAWRLCVAPMMAWSEITQLRGFLAIWCISGAIKIVRDVVDRPDTVASRTRKTTSTDGIE
jgi:hypothetical protein